MKDRLAVIAWRFGFGWLIGRRFVLLTTSDRAGGVRRTMLPYLFAAGNFYVIDASGREEWYRDLQVSPRATIQAAPGPRSVVAHPVELPEDIGEVAGLYQRRDPKRLAAALERAGIDEPVPSADAGERLHWLVFQPTGRPTPEMAAPDLAWLFPIGVVAAALLRSIRRRR